MNTIVVASVHDASTILEIQRRAFAEEGHLSESQEIPPLTETLAAVVDHIQHHTALIVRDEDRIIGSVRGIVEGAVCRIRGLSIEPSHQGQGIGSSLLRAIETAHPDVTHFELTTNTIMERNLRFYERHGYRIIELTKFSDKIILAQMGKAARSKDT